jgi:hypothetical protein
MNDPDSMIGLQSCHPQAITLLKAARQPHSREALQRILELKDRRHFQKTYIEVLLGAGWLEMTHEKYLRAGD